MAGTIDITHPSIHSYLDDVRPPSDPILQEMEALARERDFPCFGAQCARILTQLVMISGARRVFELGSGFGYTIYWMAKAMPDDGLVIGTEFDDENVALGNAFFQRGGIAHKTDLRKGDALELFGKEDGPFDLVFCDIDKESYPDAFELAKPCLRPGGLFVADNILWSGRVMDKGDEDSATQGIREFTRRIFADPDFFSTVIPIRDGISISVKAGN